MDVDGRYSIGELSRRTGVKVSTIRYYENIGLMEKPVRTQGKQRRYSELQLRRLVFIKHGRELGLPLEEIRALIRLSRDPGHSCDQADRIARQQLQAVRIRIEKLKRLEAEFERISSGCDGESVKECYVLRSLADHTLCMKEH